MNAPARTPETLAVYRTAAGRLRIVLLQAGSPCEVLDGPDPLDPQAAAARPPREGDLVLGVVRRVVKDLSAAFVDIGEEHDGFLPLSDAPPGCKAGQRLPVLVARRMPDGKGHRVDARIALPGPYAVFRPSAGPKRRTRLKSLDPAAAAAAFDRDLARLSAEWAAIAAAAASGPAPRRLGDYGAPLYRALCGLAGPATVSVRVDGSDLLALVHAEIARILPELVPLLSLSVPVGGYGLEAALGLSGLDDAMRKRTVRLPSGGSLVLDRTEALHVLDVNSGKDVRRRPGDPLALRTNLEAAREAARQIRLRDLQGILLIDFIRMETDAERTAVAAAFREAAEGDRAKVRPEGFTKLGLFEATRSWT
jgi:Ribonuclease G/E